MTRKKKSSTKKTATKRKVTKKRLPKSVPEAALTQSRERRPAPRLVIKSTKKVYKNFEKFKSYFDLSLGILMNAFIGAVALGAVFGFIRILMDYPYDDLTLSSTFLFLGASALVGTLIKMESK
ncbi:hypothetical protein N9948_00500 [bacterium]|nr:hypothetical protein [bacterium]